MFNNLESSKSYDIGDIYVGYGSPRTNIIYLHYSWNNNDKRDEEKIEKVEELNDLCDISKEISISEIEDKEEKEKSIAPSEKEFEDFDPLEYLELYGEKKINSDDEENENIEPITDNVIDDVHNIENRIQFFDNLRKSSNNALNNESNISEDGSKYLNFSDINSKLKSNLSINENISFTNIKEKIEYQQPPTPQKKKRIPFVKNVTKKHRIYP